MQIDEEKVLEAIVRWTESDRVKISDKEAFFAAYHKAGEVLTPECFEIIASSLEQVQNDSDQRIETMEDELEALRFIFENEGVLGKGSLSRAILEKGKESIRKAK